MTFSFNMLVFVYDCKREIRSVAKLCTNAILVSIDVKILVLKFASSAKHIAASLLIVTASL